MTTPSKPTDTQPVSSPLPAQPVPEPAGGAARLIEQPVALGNPAPPAAATPADASQVPEAPVGSSAASIPPASAPPAPAVLHAEELQADEEEESGPQTVVPREAEEAQNALQEVESLLKHHAAVQESARLEAERAGEHGEVPTHLLEEQYLSQLRARLENLHPADIAYVLEALPQDDRALVWDSVKRAADGAILLEVSEPVLESLIDAMSEDELVAAVKDLDADDVADLAEHLPPTVVERVQHELTPEEREQLRAVMSYPEDSVGAWMDFEFVRVREDVTLEVVLRYLRRFDELPQHTDQVFVVDRNGLLIGSLSIEQLLTNEPDTDVSEVMHREILSLEATDDVGDAAQAFERYDLVSAPVVDEAGTLIGRLTVNDVVDVIREEGETDVLNQAGLREDEDLFASVWQSASNRWLWLAVNLVTAFLASRVIGLFDGTIEKVVALAALMPIVAGLAGNSGNQTMALVIRSLALGQVTGSNFGRLLRKELTVALLNGVVWGTVAGGVSWLLYHDSEYAMLLGVAMSVAIVLNLLIAALLGVIVPFTLEKFGRDPAIGSSVLLTFSTDGLGFLIFLGLATILF
ncbi:MAG: magnesium transporter [Lautropia sp.]|nr:magnesium transporter [Lautropia sp.]